ncbi:MAG: single-stranded DNA-binding protein [Bacteroidales bacterium]
MSGINKVILVGNLGRDPEVFTFENGNKKVSIALATSEAYKNKEGQRIEQTEWHNVVFYRGLGEIAAKYLTKGSQIYVEGRIRTRTWEDNGTKKYFTEIEAREMRMLGNRKTEENTITQGTPSPMAVPPISPEEPIYDPSTDDLPF